ncbi:hypothetical protein G6F40_017314 [Rhizopus arrhizus]|nr:hypothetical protein G6F40_017314 [Rhizopus arrhizus]
MLTSFSAAMLAAVRRISPSVVAMRTPPPTDSWACGVGGDAPTLATAVAATTLGVVRDIEDDVLGGQQDSVALGRHLRALAGDGTTVGNE